jgi:hypothetical protein
MVVVPAPTPVTTPVLLTVPTAVLLLLHVPPDVALDKAVVCPTHIDVPPVMAPGGVLMVNVVVAVAVQYPPNPADTGSLVAERVYV